MGGLLHLVQRGGAWAGCGPAESPPHCTKCNSPCTHPVYQLHIILVYGSIITSAAYRWLIRCYGEEVAAVGDRGAEQREGRAPSVAVAPECLRWT